MLKGLQRQIAVIAGLLTMLVLNLATRINPADLQAQGREGVFAQYPNAFAPHPYTFAIWLPIFSGAIALTIFQAQPGRRDDARLDHVGTWLALAYSLVGGTALVDLGLSNIVVALALAAMAFALRSARAFETGRLRWLVRAPTGLFVGWLIVATTLNLCQLLVARGVDVSAGTAALLIIGAALAGLDLLRRYGEPSVALALMWAIGGIVAAHSAEGRIWAAAGISALILGCQFSIARESDQAYVR